MACLLAEAGAPLRVEVGSRVILVAGVDALWHIPDGGSETVALCGLEGLDYSFASTIRQRRSCGVCRRRHRFEDVFVVDLGPLPERAIARGGGRKKGSGRIKPQHLPVLYHLYVAEQLSCRKIGERVWQQLGFASARSAGEAVFRAFKEAGYKLRTQSEATSLRNYKHGRRTRALGETGPAVAEYRRWLKETEGRYRPRCQGVKLQPPRKGTPCTKAAMNGSDFCFGHDPARAEQRNAITAAMRERMPDRDVVPADGLRASLVAYRAGGGRWRDLSRLSGVPEHYISHVAAGQLANVSRERRERLLAVLAPPMEAAA